MNHDVVRPLLDGSVRVAGVDLDIVTVREPCPELVLRGEELHFAEVGLGAYVSALDRGASLVAIPVFPRRMLLHRHVYVRTGSNLIPASLADSRIGSIRYSTTLAVWLRGLFADRYEVRLDRAHWILRGGSAPAGVRCAVLAPGHTVEERLLSGEIDVVFSPRPMQSLGEKVERFFPDYRREEEAYLANLGFVPPMHVIVMRADRLPHNFGSRLVDAFETAKRRTWASYGSDPAVLGLLWAETEFGRDRMLCRGDPWRYGLEANRSALDLFCRYAFEQHLTTRLLAPDELFDPHADAATQYTPGGSSV